MVFSPAEIEIQDTWSVSGLCGTGSHHFVADNVLIDGARTCLALSDDACLDEPLLRIPPPSMFALEIASVAIGIAQGALEDILALSAKKVPLFAGASLAANPLFQNQIGEADAKLRAARTLLYADAAAAWATAEAGGAFAPDQRAHIRSTATWVAETAASVVDAAYGAGGGTSLYSGHPLQRRFRDVHAADSALSRQARHVDHRRRGARGRGGRPDGVLTRARGAECSRGHGLTGVGAR